MSVTLVLKPTINFPDGCWSDGLASKLVSSSQWSKWSIGTLQILNMIVIYLPVFTVHFSAHGMSLLVNAHRMMLQDADCSLLNGHRCQ